MYDQSQSVGPLLYEYSVLQRLGIPSNITDCLLQLSSNKYVIQMRDPVMTYTVDRTNRLM